MMKILQSGFCAISFVLLCYHPAFAAGRSCESLRSEALPNTSISLAESVAAGSFVTPAAQDGRGAAQGEPFKNLPAFCRVAATLKPTSDSDIRIEVWLPASGWNGKFQAVGNGGWAGAISYAAHGRRRCARLRHRSHRHRARRRQRQLRARPSRKADRLRLSLGTRDDGQGQGDRRRVLRRRAAGCRTGMAVRPAAGRG